MKNETIMHNELCVLQPVLITGSYYRFLPGMKHKYPLTGRRKYRMNIKQQILNREGKHSVIHYF